MAVTTFDRRGDLIPAGGRGVRGPALLLPAAVLGLLLAAAPARAGSIFMKNGYIIQGPIVEHSEGGGGFVVLGWPNGKVVIYKRFIEKVDFEAGEEKNLKNSGGTAANAPEEANLASGYEEELPQSLSQFVEMYKLSPALVDGGRSAAPAEGPGTAEGTSPEAAIPAAATPPPEATTGVAVVPKPPEPATGEPHPATPKPPEPEPLAGRSSNPQWGFSLEPPAGWKLAEVQGCVCWTGPAGTDGFAPSVNVASVLSGSLVWEEVCQALREDQKTALQGYESLGEETLKIGSLPAYRVGGRGVTGGPSPAGERRVVVRQTIVEKGGKIWLISTFMGESAPENLAEVLDRSVRTLQVEG